MGFGGFIVKSLILQFKFACMSYRFYIKNLEVLQHAAFWAFMFLFIYDYHFVEKNWASAAGSTILELLTYASIIYVNLFILIPSLLQKKKYGSYFFAFVFVVVGYIFTMRLTGWEKLFYEIGGWRNVFSMILNTTLFQLISTLYWYSKQWRVKREKELKLQSEKIEMELKFLRTQISPHFIFNTLNNIYSLVLEKHVNAAPMISKLSGILRYVLYESNQELVLLKNEIATLRQVIELFLLKKPKSTNLDFYVEGSINSLKIAPMLLVNIGENALKHSNMGVNENAWVKIHLSISDSGELLIEAENSVPAFEIKPEIGGIGLPNLQRQLEINYPSNFVLDTKRLGEVYMLSLKIQLIK